jgi:hypothetical protein
MLSTSSTIKKIKAKKTGLFLQAQALIGWAKRVALACQTLQCLAFFVF